MAAEIKATTDHRAQQDMPHSPSPYPPLPDDESATALEDLLASFPKPLDWDTSFDDLAPTLFASTGNDVEKSVETGSFETVSTPVQPFSPVEPPVPAKDHPLIRQNTLRQSPVKPVKRNIDSTTPTRPFKRLREALSPKSPRLKRSPSKIPLPKSPSTRRPFQPSEVDDIISAFRYTRDHLSRSIDALDYIRSDLEAERHSSEESKAAIMELLEERRRTIVEIGETQRQVDTLRDELRRVRSDSGRAAQEAQGMIAHLEANLVKEKALSATLRTEVNELARRNHYMEQTADRRVFELQQDLDLARQETAKAKGDVAEMRGRLDEADFAHRALKEGGARLARELADREKKVEELEKGKGSKRWGMI